MVSADAGAMPAGDCASGPLAARASASLDPKGQCSTSNRSPFNGEADPPSRSLSRGDRDAVKIASVIGPIWLPHPRPCADPVLTTDVVIDPPPIRVVGLVRAGRFPRAALLLPPIFNRSAAEIPPKVRGESGRPHMEVSLRECHVWVKPADLDVAPLILSGCD